MFSAEHSISIRAAFAAKTDNATPRSLHEAALALTAADFVLI